MFHQDVRSTRVAILPNHCRRTRAQRAIPEDASRPVAAGEGRRPDAPPSLHESRSVTCVQVADWLKASVDEHHPDKETLRREWMATDDRMAARAGWSLTAERIVKSPDGLDLPTLPDRIESELGKSAPGVQWTMDCCLAEIGIHFPDHRERAIDLGESSGIHRDDPVSRGCTAPFAPIWIQELVRRQG